ncbi:MAG: hypothetical protein ACLF0G_02710 [Candidatus Brocadiia bacterium]
MSSRALRGALVAMACAGAAVGGQTVRLEATADVWLSDANEQERNSSAGKCPVFKIKTIQEMAAIRFDASPARGREVRRATLFLHRASSDMLRYVRVSTVNQDWAEGEGTRPYGPPDGATYLYADAKTQRPWAWPGSEFCDVVMTSGHSLATWAERQELPDGWISVQLTPELVTAMAVGDTDGLAVMDGGNLAYHNNMVHSAQSGKFAPYIEVELGGPLSATPAQPRVQARVVPDPDRLRSKALEVSVQPLEHAFCWRASLNGEPVPRWRVAHPRPDGPSSFLVPVPEGAEAAVLRLVAVSAGGRESPPATVRVGPWEAEPPPPSLGPIRKPVAPPTGPRPKTRMRVSVLPGLVKISPLEPRAMFGDMASLDANAAWDGRRVCLFGARGETVSFQLCVENCEEEPLTGVKVAPRPLQGPGGAAIATARTELFKNWYVKNRDGRWQPAYCVPIDHGAPFRIPDPRRGIVGQRNQTVYVDLYIPKDAAPGDYAGRIGVEAEGAEPVVLPVALQVFDFALPDRLSFWPELNAYRIPPRVHDHHRLAHEHRCVANYWRFAPRVRGRGKDIEVDWARYDRVVGPLLTGEAFADCRRAGAPVEVMYLPFEDSWPTPLTKETYDYQGYWPKRGDDRKWITEHYLKAPHIGDALSQDYKDAFLAVQRQFIAHFRQKGWEETEMQCFYGGKNTHRIDWGSNMWWTTDEPYHWDDWLALQFFCRLWTRGRGEADSRLWAARADISRPNWQGRVLEGILDVEYIGGFGDPPTYRRCRILARQTGVDIRCYGAANKDNRSNTGSVVWCLDAWTNGAGAVLPWQTLGGERALDIGDRSGSGNALIVPGKRLGHTVVADMRLKALRDGQQLVEYLVELERRTGLRRDQVKAMVHAAVRIEAGRQPGAGADNADAMTFSALQAWQIAGLRRRVAEMIVQE